MGFPIFCEKNLSKELPGYAPLIFPHNVGYAAETLLKMC